jgi:hypothetical protein
VETVAAKSDEELVLAKDFAKFLELQLGIPI